MSKGLFIVLLFLHYQLSASDSLNPKQTVIVDGFVEKQITPSLPVTTYSIKSLNIAQTNQISTLLTNVSGIYLRDYGGAGAMKTISLHGGSGNQAAILLNGFKLYENANGGFNLNKLLTQSISSISIIESGFSTLVGSNAMSGGVMMNANANTDGEIILGLSQSSFNGFEGLASFTSQIGNYRNSFFLNGTISKNDFPVTTKIYSKDTTFNRMNNEFNQFSITNVLENYTKNADDFKQKLYLNYVNSYSGVPGAILQGGEVNQTSFLNENQILLISNFENNNLNFMIGGKYSQMTYFDENTLTASNSYNNYLNTNLQTRLNYNLKLFEKEFKFSTEANFDIFNGLLSQINTIETKKRYTFAIGFVRDIELENNLKVYLSSRADFISDFKREFSANFGLTKNYNDLFLSFNFGRNFRFPAFNEMYYFNFGNLNIQPENSLNINSEIKYSITDKLMIQSNVYSNFINNKILSIPRNAISWTTQNIDNNITYGIDIKLHYIENNIKSTISYCYLNAQNSSSNDYFKGKQLPYTNNHQVNASIIYNLNYIDAQLIYSFIGERYSDLNNSSNLKLSPVNLINLNLSTNKTLLEKYTISLSLNNLLNQQYEMILNFPMPNFNYRFNFGASL